MPSSREWEILDLLVSLSVCGRAQNPHHWSAGTTMTPSCAVVRRSTCAPAAHHTCDNTSMMATVGRAPPQCLTRCHCSSQCVHQAPVHPSATPTIPIHLVPHPRFQHAIRQHAIHVSHLTACPYISLPTHTPRMACVLRSQSSSLPPAPTSTHMFSMTFFSCGPLKHSHVNHGASAQSQPNSC